jgi:transaldolase
MTKLQEIANLGQSIWLDYIDRSFIASGELKKLVDKGLRGVTSNPTIFEKAIAGSTVYNEDLNHLVESGRTVEQVYEALVFDDIRKAADILLPVYEKTNCLDGYVSLEVNPNLGHDTQSSIREARRLFAELERPNVMIKVPATPAGTPAIETLIGEGVNVNVTLIFSLEQYDAVAKAYIAGLEKLASSGGDVAKVGSVASFFISRVDTAVDWALAEVSNTEMQGKIAVDQAKIAYARFKEIFSGERWERLAVKGGRAQRPLWASTGTKNPAYPDTLYVDKLVGPDTVNTLPPNTLDAFLDHGNVATTLESDMAGAGSRIGKLLGLGIDLDAISKQLLEDGVKSFAKSFDALLASITEKREKLLWDWQQPSAGFGPPS